MPAPDPSRLRHLFDAAMERPAAERAAYVASSCRGDTALQQRLLAMLEAADDERFLVAPTSGARAGAATTDSAPIGEDVGARIGPYTLLQQLGEGGFGRVFLAKQDEPVARQVALKVVKAGMDTRQVVARFEQERQALALMDHPHIARVIDAGATAAGRPYFVMDLVRGLPIVAYCDRDQLTVEARLAIFVQVCDAVQHAHGKGVIHRDLKPSNVLVTMQDGHPHAKVIDFGVAKATAQPLTDKTLYTEQRQVIGTLQYMSPEQAEGSLDIDTRTDVYALGVLLYELLTGSTPFDRTALRASELGELQRVLREHAPQRPSQRVTSAAERLPTLAAQRRTDERRLPSRLRGELDWIVMKAIEKDRTRRYDTAAALGLDVQRHLRGETVLAAPPSTGYRLRTFVRRNRVLVGAAAAVTLTLVLGVVGTSLALVQAVHERQRADLATAAEREARTVAQQNEQQATAAAERALLAQRDEATARRRAERIRDFVVSTLRTSDASEEGGREDTTILEAMDAAIAEVDSPAFADDPAAAADLKLTIAGILRVNGRMAASLQQAEQALVLLRSVHPGDHLDVAAAINDVARAAERLNRRDEAERHFREALAMYERLLPGDNGHTAALRNNVGEMRNLRGRPDEALPYLEQAVAMYRRLGPDHERPLALCLDNVAKAKESLGDAAAALPLQQQAVDMLRRHTRGDHPSLAVVLNNLAVLEAKVGDDDKADALFLEALSMRQRMFQGDHPVVAEGLLNLAMLRTSRGRAAAAVDLLEQGVAMNARLYPGDHPMVAHGLLTLGSTRLALGDAIAAEKACDRAVAMHRALFAGDHIGTAMSLAGRARARAAQPASAAAATADFVEATAMLHRLPEGPQPLRQVLWHSAQHRLATGDATGALPELEELLQLGTKALAPDSPWLARYREALATCKEQLANAPR
jgi:serine/threonine protein kinase/tetratricopeptide (TPR) repeat protein